MAIQDSMFQATLKNENSMEILISRKYSYQGVKSLSLYENEKFVCTLEVASCSDNSKYNIYHIDHLPEFHLGSNYTVYDERNMCFPVDISCLMRNEKFIHNFRFNGEMGAIYSRDGTTFRVFAPLASSMSVLIFNGVSTDLKLSQSLEKDVRNGIFEGTVDGDFDGDGYLFAAYIGGRYVTAVDPYARSVTNKSTRGVIINPEKTKVNLREDHLPEMTNNMNAVIYEMNIRDMTSQKNKGFAHSGKYLGLTETGLKTKGHLPMGIDYLASLGITHVQIMPMYDFISTSDEHPEDTYNWGYDPLNYNAPEGSFSTHPEDPYCRIKELKSMVAGLHEKGIRVIMDVVFNHVFSVETCNFEMLCPGYYFRFNEDGSPANGSFCGNEFESRHFMARKFIVDTCLYWMKEYGIDGYRFDLMGLLDLTTVNEVEKECRKIKKDFIVYGEGWDMYTPMDGSEKASMYNAEKMPEIGFFNDRYRDIVKGKTSDHEILMRGYLSGDFNYRDGFKHVYAGSVLPIAFPPLFKDPSQTINYVECHDNFTLYDKLKRACPEDTPEELLRRIRLINNVNIFAIGVPLFHMGQEIGLSKNGDGNSYKSGDKINQFKWDELDEKKELYESFVSALSLKKQMPCFSIYSREEAENSIVFENIEKGGLCIRYTNLSKNKPYHDIRIYINPGKETLLVDLKDYYRVLYNGIIALKEPVYAQNLLVNGLSLIIVAL